MQSFKLGVKMPTRCICMHMSRQGTSSTCQDTHYSSRSSRKNIWVTSGNFVKGKCLSNANCKGIVTPDSTIFWSCDFCGFEVHTSDRECLVRYRILVACSDWFGDLLQ